MLLTGGIKQAVGEKRTPVTDQAYPHRLGDRFEMSFKDSSGYDLHGTFVYTAVGTVNLLVTDIKRWVPLTKLTYPDTDASNFIVGLQTGSAVGIAAELEWTQCGGEKLTYPDGTRLSNNLLGDGSVASGEGIMPHATTDGMVDTDAGAAVQAIGAAGENDAPAITLYMLWCLAGLL